MGFRPNEKGIRRGCGRSGSQLRGHRFSAFWQRSSGRVVDVFELSGKRRRRQSLTLKMVDRFKERCVGPKNTVRFQWWEEDFPKMARDNFAKDLLIGSLGIKLEEVLCLQDNPREKGYDVTFYEQETITRMAETFARSKVSRMFPGLRVCRLGALNQRILTVHMYDPDVPEKDIVGFLKRFGHVAEGKITKVMDRTGFWTGRRTFQMGLNNDPAGHDGLAHPPAFFTIGANRGYLSYYRQSLFCRKCRGSGHKEKDCEEGAKCRFCLSKEHATKDCPRPKKCHACGSTNHLLKDCSEKRGSGGGGPGKGAEASGRIEGASKAAAALGPAKEGARTGSQAFNGNGSAEKASGEKKSRKQGEVEESMDSTQSGEDMTGGGVEGEAVPALSFDSRQPACLFSPASPLTEHGVSPQWADQGEEEGQT